MKHIGIDFGAKMAGTTAISFLNNQKIEVIISEKNKDADKFLSDFICINNPEYIFIDAPLSLPAAFYGKGENYFYRECDMITKAMSPMFLGGLTARAMSLKGKFKDVKFIETYPKILGNLIEINDYKKNNVIFVKKIEAKFDISISKLDNWHKIDAVLAYCSGLRYFNDEYQFFGNQEEGLIIV
jgi:predicted nuclease with RNAse H fold